MPIIDLDIQRTYSELLNAEVTSGQLKNYKIGAMLEKIKFRIDEVGAKVENEAMMMVGITSVNLVRPKRLHLDEEFWVLMRQKGGAGRPYFLLKVTNDAFMVK